MAEIGDGYLANRRLPRFAGSGGEAGKGRLRQGFGDRLALACMTWLLLRVRDRRPERMDQPDGDGRRS